MQSPRDAKPDARRRRACAALLALAAVAACPPRAAVAGPVGEMVRQWSAYVKARRHLGPDAPRPEGPIAASYQQWSTRRQARARVERPFTNQTGDVVLNGPSPWQSLRSKLTRKSGDVANTHRLRTDIMKHERGVLQR